MSRVDEEFERLCDGRDLNAFDREAVMAVAGLFVKLRDARDSVELEGLIIDGGKGFPVEHPALVVEKRCAAEIRGWVKDRPDLFGERKQKRERRRPDFKVV